MLILDVCADLAQFGHSYQNSSPVYLSFTFKPILAFHYNLIGHPGTSEFEADGLESKCEHTFLTNLIKNIILHALKTPSDSQV